MGRGSYALCCMIHFLCERGGTTSSSQYHWRSKPFVLWLLLTLECMANYNSPSVGDCCKLRQDMKGLWGMAVLVMGRGQIEQPWGQNTSIISIVPLVQRQSKGPGLGLRGWYPPTKRNETNGNLYPQKCPGFCSCWAFGQLFLLITLSYYCTGIFPKAILELWMVHLLVNAGHR